VTTGNESPGRRVSPRSLGTDRGGKVAGPSEQVKYHVCPGGKTAFLVKDVQGALHNRGLEGRVQVASLRILTLKRRSFGRLSTEM